MCSHFSRVSRDFKNRKRGLWGTVGCDWGTFIPPLSLLSPNHSQLCLSWKKRLEISPLSFSFLEEEKRFEREEYKGGITATSFVQKRERRIISIDRFQSPVYISGRAREVRNGLLWPHLVPSLLPPFKRVGRRRPRDFLFPPFHF